MRILFDKYHKYFNIILQNIQNIKSFAKNIVKSIKYATNNLSFYLKHWDLYVIFNNYLKQWHWGEQYKLAIITLTASLGLTTIIAPNLTTMSAAMAEQNVATENNIIEYQATKTITTEPSLYNAAINYVDYYNNLAIEQKPEDFLGVYLVEDSEFVLGTQSLQEVIGQPTRNLLMTYTVKPGDSLSNIAQAFGISVDTIKLANHLTKTILQPGQELIILPVSGIYYTIQKGDTLSKISQTYKVSLSAIKEYNDIDENNIRIGDKIILPGAKAPQTTIVANTNSSSATSNISPQNISEAQGYFIYPTTGWNWGTLHNNNAVDIANACGTPIYAAQEGLVIEALSSGWNSGYGSYIKIQHPNGTMTLYAHLSEVDIITGTSVKQGDFIARMGATGKATGCHLHFEVRGAKNPFAK